ncbi:MAG TPA: S1/P1 nuclease [Nitrospira sp.]|nr:S1/P1 nuclease [Nitrospira sp.]
MRRLAYTFLAFCVLVPCSSLYAWDTSGHAIVAMLAEERLTPTAKAAVSDLLQGHPLVDVASWADQVRNQQTAPWHYVNIEIDETQYDTHRHCPDRQCVTEQVERFRATLADDSLDPMKRQKALKYLVHFVADLHQPLHAGQNHDRGGNDAKVEFLGRAVNPFTKKPWNLHQVWDNGLLDQYAPNAKQAVIQIDQYLASQNEAELAIGSVIQWAMQSHDHARDHAYRFGTDKRLNEQYVKQALPVIEAQLARAGVRLAFLLNTALRTEAVDSVVGEGVSSPIQ